MTTDEEPSQASIQCHEDRGGEKPSWRELAQATAEEQDPAEVVRRAQELIRALDGENGKRGKPLHHRQHKDKAAS